MKRRTTRVLSIILFAAMMLQALGLTAAAATQGSTAPQQTSGAQDYGLPAKTKDGVIFHAWNWSFDNITNNLPAIAEAGFKSIQTSPIQASKEALTDGSKWWVLYQPTNFQIGNTQLGSREQFKRLCEEAEKYGISIIVDVIANHTGNAGGGALEVQPAHNVDPVLKNNPNFWHSPAKHVESWDRRWNVTQQGIGLPDLNTSNQELQNIIIAFLNDAISLGADGFRFDAAKHIELPDDPDNAGSNFWPRVLGSLTNKENLYIYGEVLQGGADRFNDYATYMNLAADKYGHNIRDAVGFSSSKNVDTAKFYSAG
ncbi:alpha-amylase family glycosyl hydrolase, partial [Paenibacillus plantiphilus]|uniref:alpha-amylase family glycosyl hydrolase n=1 Tax=Paenibacillus plantiphilus TaxID=2905650 RepID=UPI00209698D5